MHHAAFLPAPYIRMSCFFLEKNTVLRHIASTHLKETREMSKFLICEHCSSRMDYTESVAEIVPQDVEYLVNCVFEEQAGKDGEA